MKRTKQKSTSVVNKYGGKNSGCAVQFDLPYMTKILYVNGYIKSNCV